MFLIDLPFRRNAAIARSGRALMTSVLAIVVSAPVIAADPPRGSDEATPAPSSSTSEQPADAGGELPAWAETTLTGDWDGARKRLFDAGVQVDLAYTADYLRDNRGGAKRGGAYMGHVDLILQLDGEKLVGWKGGSALLQLISNSGGRVNLNYVGSLMGVDNFEAPVNRTGIFKAWLQQSFLDDQASLRVGLYPIDTEFYVTDSSGIFLHPSFGMAAEVASFGTLAGPSIYATSSYGARLRVDPDPAWYGMIAVTRGISSDRIDTAGPNLSWQKSIGSMVIGEIGMSPVKAGLFGAAPAAEDKSDYQPISKLALGAWRYAPRMDQLTAVNADGEPLQATHWGAYVLAEQTLYRIPDSTRDLAGFIRYGLTDGKTNVLDYSLSVGLNFRGPFASREKDSVGIAATRGHVGPQGRTLLAADSGESLKGNAETAVEVTYRAQLAPGVALQPVLQRIFNPGLTLPNATVAGARLQFAL